MTEGQLLQEFEGLAERLDIPVVYADVEDGQGGLCHIRGKMRFIIHSGLEVQTRNEIFAREFARMSLDGIYVVPLVRERIDAQGEHLA